MPKRRTPPAPEDPKAAEAPEPEARLTLVMRAELLERVRNAAFWSPGETLAAIGHRGITAELARMERQNGGKFPPRTKPNRIGRPPK
jgi:hypothetical protein